MNIKISGQSSKSNYHNTGSCAGAVYYNEHDLREMLGMAEDSGVRAEQMQFFDMEGHAVSAAEVLDKVDRNRAGLHKDDAKFFCLMIDPSDSEIATIGDTLAEQLEGGRQYVFDVMDAYAKNFHREGIEDRHNLTAYAIPHLYKGKDEDKKGQIHWHIIVARKDASNKYKLSPLTNHRGTTKGAVKGGFDRVAFDSECERLFDVRFGYERKVEESFGYCLAQKKGTPEQKAEQTRRLAEQNRPDLEAAVSAFLTHRVAQLAAEATARAIEQQKAKEEAARQEAARIEKANKNSYWNSYNSHYKPLIEQTKGSCNKAFTMYRDAKDRYGVTSQAISDKYNQLSAVYNQMNTYEDAVKEASTAKGLSTAAAVLVGFLNPFAGLIIGLVGRIIAESERSAAIETKRELRAQAQQIRGEIEGLKQKQAELKQEKTDTLRAYVENKEAKTELFAEMNAFRDQLLKPVEAPKPKITFDFKAAAQKSAQTQAPCPAQTAPASSSVNIFSVMMNARTREEFNTSLPSKMISIEPIHDRFGGVADFKVILAREGRVTNASSLVSPEQLRSMLDRWEVWTKQIPAYKLAIEREHREKLADICRKMDQEIPSNAPRIPKNISFRQDGSVKSVSYIDSKGHEETLNVDPDNYVRWKDGSAININTGKYYAPRPQIKYDESHNNTEHKSARVKVK